MLLSAECIVEGVKHMLTVKERGILRQTCKAFRELRIREDYFDVQYVMLLRRNGIQLTTKDGESIIRCTGWLLNDTKFTYVERTLDQFARIINGIHKDQIPKNSIVSVYGIAHMIATDIEALDNTEIDGCIISFGGYTEFTFRYTIELDTYKTTDALDMVKISSPKRIPVTQVERFYAENFNYIKYPELILSPSDA